MDVGESTVTIAEHPTIGPLRIEIHQPFLSPNPSRPPGLSTSEQYLACILDRLEQIRDISERMYNYQTRPSIWKRIITWVKRHVPF
jgi:hypothetical protein